jgi:hypothetical protein
MFGSPESWIRAVAPFLFYLLDVAYFFIGGIGVNDFAVKDCTTCCLVNSFKFSIPLHSLTLQGIDPHILQLKQLLSTPAYHIPLLSALVF